MYYVSPEGLHKMEYCNGVKGFINYTLSNTINISGGDIICPYKRCKNKKFLDLDVVMINLLQKKRVEGEILVLACTQRTIYSLQDHDRNDGGSTSSCSNVHGVVDDNDNSYKSMVIDAMIMN